MEMTINIDVEAITKEVQGDLDIGELTRSVLSEFEYNSRFGEMVAEACGISEVEERLGGIEEDIESQRNITEELLVESLVKALTSMRDGIKEKEEANRELRKEIRALKEGKSDD